ncbi:MAG: DUF2087 domain-containing protein [Caulobacteraceae bacterium]|nr:DUF2087 domain-containing protein [Caulobacteraceae bacterium]
MPRLSLPYAVPDLSALARSLKDQIAKLDRSPSHLEVLNMLARAAGRRNYQHYQSQMASEARLSAPAPDQTPPDHALLRRALFEAKLVDRTPDVREYRRIERKPPPDLAILLERTEPRIDA